MSSSNAANGESHEVVTAAIGEGEAAPKIVADMADGFASLAYATPVAASPTGAAGAGGSACLASLSTDAEQASLALFHTRYHAVPKLELLAPMATKW